ncbi:MAG TPA: Crp/Fnr family transcriptional regulator [Terriglobales bacterium]|nr:Crp/Fnr family transcriptional regulator [Terriglobales bacterium]
MITDRSTGYRNQILSSLPKHELRALEPHLVAVDLPRRFVLSQSLHKNAFGYFLESGLASVVVILENGNTVEVGVVGFEGMVGSPILLGTESIPCQTFMLMAGSGYRIKASVLKEQFEDSPQLRRMLMRYFQLHLVQASQTAACNRLHEVEERMARWLLICKDRVDSEDISLTHEFLAQMLGSRRSSVTIAAGALQRAGLIDYSRGHVRILDIEGLEKSACECFRAIHNEQARLGLLPAVLSPSYAEQTLEMPQHSLERNSHPRVFPI